MKGKSWPCVLWQDRKWLLLDITVTELLVMWKVLATVVNPEGLCSLFSLFELLVLDALPRNRCQFWIWFWELEMEVEMVSQHSQDRGTITILKGSLKSNSQFINLHIIFTVFILQSENMFIILMCDLQFFLQFIVKICSKWQIHRESSWDLMKAKPDPERVWIVD